MAEDKNKPTLNQMLGSDELTRNVVSDGLRQTADKTTASSGDTSGSNSGVGTSTDVERLGASFDEPIRRLKEEQAKIDIEDPEKRRKREKRERASRIIAKVTDGVRALSNVYFTSKGAPNMIDANNTATKAVDDRLKKAQEERDKNKAEYDNYAQKIGDLEREKVKTVHEAKQKAEEAQIKRDKAAREEQEQKWKEAMQPDLRRKAAAEADTAEYKAVTAASQARYADPTNAAKVENLHGQRQVQQSTVNRNNSTTNRNNSAAAASDRKNTDYTETETKLVQAKDRNGKPMYDADGNPVMRKVERTKTKEQGVKKKKANPMGNGKKENPMH